MQGSNRWRPDMPIQICTCLLYTSCRAKGASGERELFSLLSAELGFVVKRELGASRDGGCDGLNVPGCNRS